MIEIILAKQLSNKIQNVYALELPERCPLPACCYSVQGFKKVRELNKSKHYTMNFQVNVFANSYSSAKGIQSKVLDIFDDYDDVVELNDKKYSITTEVTNIIDLFKLNSKQIAIDIQVEYIIS